MEKDTKQIIEYNTLTELFTLFINNPTELSKGYKTLEQKEDYKGFHLGLIRLSFDQSVIPNIKKLASCTSKIFLKKNWKTDKIETSEKTHIIQILFENLGTDDYYYKNFIAKILSMIAKKELPNIYEGFLDNLLELLEKCDDENIVDTFLRILLNVVNECDERIIDFSEFILPKLYHTFTSSQNNKKNQEYCMKIFSLMLAKISSKEHVDQEVMAKCLESWIYPWLGLFNTIIQANPKFLLDIKKLTIRSIDILVRDLQIYFSQHIQNIILPIWKLILFELPLFTETIIFNKKIEYTEDEENDIEEKNYLYTRGYESEEEDEKYGVEGLIDELTNLTIDLLKSRNIKNALKNELQTFLLCIKGYCLLPYNSIKIWKNDPNLYISEEFDEENVNSIRNKALALIKEITYEMEDDAILEFLKMIISELSEGIKTENYSEVLKLDDFNLLNTYFEKMNTIDVYKFRRFEANLLILGILSKDLIVLRRKNKIQSENCHDILKFLFQILSNKSEDKNYGILVGRAIWCIGRMIEIFSDDQKTLVNIFEEATNCLSRYKTDLTIFLITCKVLTKICLFLDQNNFDSEKIIDNYKNIIEMLKKTNEYTLFYPIQTINRLSKLNKKKALYVPLNASEEFLNIYSKYYNHPEIGIEILNLIKLWCEDDLTAKILLRLFIPFAIFVFEEFYKNLSNPEKEQFDDIKKTIMTTHGNQDLMLQTSLSMLPNLIDVILMLMKFCVATKDFENLSLIGLIVSIICDIVAKTEEAEILRRGVVLLKLYIPLCKDIILQRKQENLIIKVINKFLQPTQLESSLLYVGNVITQYFAHISKRIETEILDSVVRKIYKSRMPSIVQSLVLVYSRLIIKYPNEIISFLSQVSIENRAGLKVLIDKWLLHLPRFSGKYCTNLSLKAITLLYSIKNELIESLMVIGYDPSHSTASVEVNAPLKILSTLIRCLNNEIKAEQNKTKNNNLSALEKEMRDKNFFDEEESKENFEDNFKDERLDNEGENLEMKPEVNLNEFKELEAQDKVESKLNFINLQGKSGGLSNIETGSEIYLSQMIGFDYNDMDAEDEDNNEDDLVLLVDIEYDFTVKDYLIEFFKNKLTNDSEYLKECLRLLPRSDQEMFKNFNF